MAPLCYRRHRFPPEIIQHAIWLYLRFTLSYRDVEELLAERGLDISYETVRRRTSTIASPASPSTKSPSSHWTRRWREKDSNHRSPVRRTTFFRFPVQSGNSPSTGSFGTGTTGSSPPCRLRATGKTRAAYRHGQLTSRERGQLDDAPRPQSDRLARHRRALSPLRRQATARKRAS
jgi:hypothetical protein